MFGMTVSLKIDSRVGVKNVVLNNVTEIHYNYMSCGKTSYKTAFESDIHSTGVCYQNYEIVEMEVKSATKIAKEF